MRPRLRGLARTYGRHRLGAPGLVHCALHAEVAAALTRNRRGGLAALLVPARHSLAGLRRRAATTGAWSPVANVVTKGVTSPAGG